MDWLKRAADKHQAEKLEREKEVAKQAAEKRRLDMEREQQFDQAMDTIIRPAFQEATEILRDRDLPVDWQPHGHGQSKDRREAHFSIGSDCWLDIKFMGQEVQFIANTNHGQLFLESLLVDHIDQEGVERLLKRYVDKALEMMSPSG